MSKALAKDAEAKEERRVNLPRKNYTKRRLKDKGAVAAGGDKAEAGEAGEEEEEEKKEKKEQNLSADGEEKEEKATEDNSTAAAASRRRRRRRRRRGRRRRRRRSNTSRGTRQHRWGAPVPHAPAGGAQVLAERRPEAQTAAV